MNVNIFDVMFLLDINDAMPSISNATCLSLPVILSNTQNTKKTSIDTFAARTGKVLVPNQGCGTLLSSNNDSVLRNIQ